MPPLLTRLTLFLGFAAAAAAADRTRFDHSILAVPSVTDSVHPRRGRVVRAALKSTEQSATVRFEIALKMRNFAELQERIGHGEQIPRAEMATRYFPLAADETRIANWLRAQGLTVDRVDDNHLAIFGSGPARVAAVAFDTTFARVSNPDGEFTSAITAPSLPSDFASAVVGVHGLQPHLRPHRLARLPAVTPAASAAYLPAQILTAYQAANLGLNGSGQTIAIFAAAYPSSSDLTSFWTQAGVNASLGNITPVNIEGGPSSPVKDALIEVSLDVEWASAVAPAAKIRIYAADEDNEAGFDLGFQQVYADLPSNPTLHVFSISFGGNEVETDQDFLVIEAQYMANLASAGVTVVASSGDDGSSPDNILQVNYPACDPNVTGVGGTTLVLDSSNNISSEKAWSPIGFNTYGSSGGGSSVVYARPSWQTGTGVPVGNFRLVPDVAGPANPNDGAVVVQAGMNQTIGGTSWSTPLWAGFAALINQSRATSGAGPLGALNPRLYPLLGTSAFHDVTSGNNGAYNAGVGYDRVTGLGSPNVAALLQSGLTGSAPLAIVVQLPAAFTIPGQSATFDVVASGTGPFVFQWQREAIGASTWSNLSDDGTYAGTTTPTMVIAQATSAMNGDHYRCVVSNSSGSVTGTATALTVSSTGVTTLAGWPGSAGRVDGTGYGARFDFDGAITNDSSGNLYVTDGGGNTVRKVTPQGVVTTLAGRPGVAGWQDGANTVALFNGPAGIALDPQGNIFVADEYDCTIRKISSGGGVTTFAGTGNTSGSADGRGTAASFTDPSALVSDSAGNLYLADGKGNSIRKITPSGDVTTITSQLNEPEGVAVDGAGNIYVADSGNNCIRLITASGTISLFAGSASGVSGSTDGTGTSARFFEPTGLRVDPASGNLFVCDAGNCTIRMITPQGVVKTVAGTVGALNSADGPSSAAEFNAPGDLTITSGGVIYVADSLNYSVRQITSAAPQLISQPSSILAINGYSNTFAVAVSSTASTPLVYQWQILVAGSSNWAPLADGGIYFGTATSVLSFSAVNFTLSGVQYRCIVSNAGGSVTSSAATLTVVGPPVISSSTQTTSVAPGDSITLTTVAMGPGLSYQWYFNNQAIANATSSSLTVTSFSSANAGTYTVKVTNTYGFVTGTAALLSVGGGRLINLSSRSVASGANPLTVGFILGGGGTKNLLLRGIGPSLTTFGVSNVLPDPELTFLDSSKVQRGFNAGWGSTSALAAVFTQTGAFALQANSSDAALLATGVDSSSGANYTVIESSVSGDSGAVLNEIYDADTIPTSARLINLSVLGSVSQGTPLIAGFVVGGTGNETVLIRGIGPALVNFGITNFLANPVLTVYGPLSTTVPLITNAAWSSNSAMAAQLTNTFTTVGAFTLANGSSDTAALLTVSAGNYSAIVSTTNGTPGQALIEIYEVSP